MTLLIDAQRAATPAEIRAAIRQGLDRPTAGLAPGYVQANLIALPYDDAFDFLLFAQRNPKPCPIVGVLEPGQYSSEALPGGDIRTDIPGYRLYEHGELVGESTDATAWWDEDMVAFLIGCSFTFEAALLENGVPVAHIEQGRNVPMYLTNLDTTPGGKFHGPMVVSMRPIPAGQVADAVRITSRYPAVHGAPVHVGDPAAIGIADISRPDFGEAVECAPGTVPVFWGCGVTPQSIVMSSKPRKAICHAPGKMLVTDLKNVDYQIP